MSSLDSLIRKPTHRIKQRVASCRTAEVISIQSLPAPLQTPRDNRSQRWVGVPPPCLVWTSSPSHRLTLVLDFPIFSALGRFSGSKCRFLVRKSAKKIFARHSNLLAGRMNTHIHIEHRLFQDVGLPRRVENFRENRPRDVEKSVDEKNNTTKT